MPISRTRSRSSSRLSSSPRAEWLSLWVLVSSLCSNWGLFASTLLEDSYQLLGMAEAGLAPKLFKKRHPRLGTPVRAILLQVVIVGVLAGLDFSVIM